ncbi:hypothetical protein FRB95_006948 [Tulasnella sp. JGI-2019a]|nr:hypothetical protein FRB95_006948 [Tulasnella sp. JGI-2019a]
MLTGSNNPEFLETRWCENADWQEWTKTLNLSRDKSGELMVLEGVLSEDRTRKLAQDWLECALWESYKKITHFPAIPTTEERQYAHFYVRIVSRLPDKRARQTAKTIYRELEKYNKQVIESNRTARQPRAPTETRDASRSSFPSRRSRTRVSPSPTPASGSNLIPLGPRRKRGAETLPAPRRVEKKKKADSKCSPLTPNESKEVETSDVDYVDPAGSSLRALSRSQPSLFLHIETESSCLARTISGVASRQSSKGDVESQLPYSESTVPTGRLQTRATTTEAVSAPPPKMGHQHGSSVPGLAEKTNSLRNRLGKGRNFMDNPPANRTPNTISSSERTLKLQHDTSSGLCSESNMSRITIAVSEPLTSVSGLADWSSSNTKSTSRPGSPSLSPLFPSKTTECIAVTPEIPDHSRLLTTDTHDLATEPLALITSFPAGSHSESLGTSTRTIAESETVFESSTSSTMSEYWLSDFQIEPISERLRKRKWAEPAQDVFAHVKTKADAISGSSKPTKSRTKSKKPRRTPALYSSGATSPSDDVLLRASPPPGARREPFSLPIHPLPLGVEAIQPNFVPFCPPISSDILSTEDQSSTSEHHRALSTTCTHLEGAKSGDEILEETSESAKKWFLDNLPAIVTLGSDRRLTLPELKTRDRSINHAANSAEVALSIPWNNDDFGSQVHGREKERSMDGLTRAAGPDTRSSTPDIPLSQLISPPLNLETLNRVFLVDGTASSTSEVGPAPHVRETVTGTESMVKTLSVDAKYLKVKGSRRLKDAVIHGPKKPKKKREGKAQVTSGEYHQISLHDPLSAVPAQLIGPSVLVDSSSAINLVAAINNGEAASPRPSLVQQVVSSNPDRLLPFESAADMSVQTLASYLQPASLQPGEPTQMTGSADQSQRPPLPASPLVWAINRQEICEGLPYFRSFQGGVYSSDDIAFGYLVDGYGAPRDTCAHGGRLIISHVGGKSHSVTTTTEHGKVVAQELKENQREDQASARALLNNFILRKPLVLLAGKDYAHMPYDPQGKGYIVLGWYIVTHFWTEKEPVGGGNTFNRIKVAFQWLPSQGVPFAVSRTPGSPTEPSSAPITNAPPVAPQVEGMGKLVLRRTRAFKVANGALVNSTTITQGRDPRNQDSDSFHPAKEVCTACHMHSPHIYTIGWMCLNGSCDSQFWKLTDGTEPEEHSLQYCDEFLKLDSELPEVPIPHDIQPARLPKATDFDGCVTSANFMRAMHCRSCGRVSCRKNLSGWKCANPACNEQQWLWDNTSALDEPPEQTEINVDFDIEVKDNHTKVQRKMSILPDNAGGGPIKVTTYTLDCGFIYHLECNASSKAAADSLLQDYQRVDQLRRQGHVLDHRCLGQQFVMNSGAAYHFVAEAETIPFTASAECVNRALAMIDTKAALVCRKDLKKFPFNELLSICYLEGQHINYHSDDEAGLGDVIASLSLGQDADMDFRIQSSVPRVGRLLRITLRHGDVVVMHGRKIQDRYQHKVTPEGFRIGVTARQIYTGEHVPLTRRKKPEPKGDTIELIV